MKRHFVVIAIAALGAALAPAEGAAPETAAGPAAYARLRSLVGEWEAETAMGKAHYLGAAQPRGNAEGP